MKEFKSVFKNEELRAYLGIIAGATVVITCNIAGGYHSLLKAFRYAAFQVASVITTTGFVTADFNKWLELSKCVLLLVMVIGASAGSTGGGIKVSKTSDPGKKHPPGAENYDPSESSQYRKSKWEKMKEETMRGVYVYFIAYILILIVSVLLISINNFDFTTSFTGVLTTLNNVGPGTESGRTGGKFCEVLRLLEDCVLRGYADRTTGDLPVLDAVLAVTLGRKF